MAEEQKQNQKDAEAAPVGAGYVVARLLRSIETSQSHQDPETRERAVRKIRQWEQVLTGMLSGTLETGSRTPVEGVPAWVTLEVAQGGFATGNLMAGGDLQVHEQALLARISGDHQGRERAALNIYYLSEPGQLELRHMLDTGCYRIHVPEEGALLVVTWLLSRKLEDQARVLLDSITPFFDRLRFYPVPDPAPVVSSPFVKRQTTSEIASELERYSMSSQIGRMLEALKIWQPMCDRAVALMLETVEGGNPCRQFPGGWKARAQALLDEYVELRKVHRSCGKPDRPKENFARLRGYLKTCIEGPEKLTARDLGMVRKVLRDYQAAHGVAGSEEFRNRRAAQAHVASLPTHEDLNEVLIGRLRNLPQGSGVTDLEAVIAPVTREESARFAVPEGAKIPGGRASKTRRCLEAPVEHLVEKGIIPSGEVLAVVLPQITSHIRAAGIADAELRRLYSAIYVAFRRRRSLLLLHLSHQVRIDELPWVAAFGSQRRDDLDARESARQSFEQLALLAIGSFPQAILPNKLLQEFRALSKAADVPVPLVDEIAADIFVGTFTAKFLDAAQIAAPMLRGTLYERYFGIPYEQVQRMRAEKAGNVEVATALTLLCEALAVSGEARSVVRNGTILEQSQIITTQNLAAIVDRVGLRPHLEGRLRTLAEICFRWICARQSLPPRTWRAELKSVKNCAYAWRQMIFYLALTQSEAEVTAFLSWAGDYLEHPDRTDQAKRRLRPVLDGLAWVAGGGRFDEQGRGGPDGEHRRFLGWTIGRHWLFGDTPAPPSLSS